MLQKKRLYFLVGLILVSLVALFACEAAPSTTPAQTPTQTQKPVATSTPTPTSTATAKPTATPTATQPAGPQQYGGVIKIIASPGITNLGYPGKAYTPGAIIYSRPAVEYLLSFNPDGSGEAVGELAESYKWGPDNLSLTLNLRKGIKFHDGTDFNAEAVKINLELHKAGVRTELQPVKSIDIVDDYTVRLNLTRYDSGFLLGLMSLSGYIVSPTYLKKAGDEALYNPVGTGPFKFAEYKRDVSLKYVRNENYWQKGKPYLDGIEFVFIKDPVTQIAVLKAGDAQVLRTLEVKDVPDLDRVKFNIVMSPGSVDGLAGDSKHPTSPFSKLEVRQAVAYAVNNQAIAKALGYGYWESVNQWFPKQNIAHNPNIVGYPYNPQKAKELLTKAGYPKGFETEIYYEAGVTAQQNLYSAVQGFLGEVGINAKLKPTDRAAFNSMVAGGWNNALVHIYTAVALGVDPVSTLRTKMCSIASRYDVKNSLWIPPDYDALYFKIAAETDMAKYKAGFMTLGKMMIDDYLIAIPLEAPSQFLAKTPQVRDFDMHVYGLAEWRPELAWLSK